MLTSLPSLPNALIRCQSSLIAFKRFQHVSRLTKTLQSFLTRLQTLLNCSQQRPEVPKTLPQTRRQSCMLHTYHTYHMGLCLPNLSCLPSLPNAPICSRNDLKRFQTLQAASGRFETFPDTSKSSQNVLKHFQTLTKRSQTLPIC